MLDAGVQRFSNRKSPRICHYPAVGCLPGDYYQLPWLNMPESIHAECAVWRFDDLAPNHSMEQHTRSLLAVQLASPRNRFSLPFTQSFRAKPEVFLLRLSRFRVPYQHSLDPAILNLDPDLNIFC
jgi:hypothetical protein